MDHALRLLSRREHSRKELEEKLRRRGFGLAEISEALSELESQGWLDNRRSAQHLAKELLGRRGYGLARAVRELRERGFGPDEIEHALEGFAGEEAELERARSAATRLLCSERKDFRRVARFLERRGFGAQVILEVLREGNFGEIDGEDLLQPGEE